MLLGVSADNIAISEIGQNYANNQSSLQGLFNNVTYCFGDSLTALQSELISRQLWDNMIEKSFYHSAATMIEYYLKKINTYEQHEQFYLYCKSLVEKIVPESLNRDCIPDESILRVFMDGSNFDRYLYQILTTECSKLQLQCSELQGNLDQATSTIQDLKKSLSYRLALAITYVPRKVKLLLKKLVN